MAQDNSTQPKSKRTPEYMAWVSMLQRCLNPRHKAYAYYGGRGITVCQRWRESHVWFLVDVGPRPGPEYSIDRIDNNRNYEPGNVKWSTRDEQQKNMRCNINITIDGKTACVAEWARRLGISPELLRDRLNRGIPVERAIIPALSRQVLTLGGITLTVAEWARQASLCRETLTTRIDNGWPLDLTILQPADPHRSRRSRRKAIHDRPAE